MLAVLLGYLLPVLTRGFGAERQAIVRAEEKPIAIATGPAITQSHSQNRIDLLNRVRLNRKQTAGKLCDLARSLNNILWWSMT